MQWISIYQLGKRIGAFLQFSGTRFLFINGTFPVYSHGFLLTGPTPCLEQGIFLTTAFSQNEVYFNVKCDGSTVTGWEIWWCRKSCWVHTAMSPESHINTWAFLNFFFLLLEKKKAWSVDVPKKPPSISGPLLLLLSTLSDVQYSSPWLPSWIPCLLSVLTFFCLSHFSFACEEDNV